MSRQTPILDYSTRPRKAHLLRLLGWLMPLWCALIILVAYWPIRHRSDDPYWLVGIVLPFLAGCAFLIRGVGPVGVYCVMVSLLVLLCGIILPSLKL